MGGLFLLVCYPFVDQSFILNPDSARYLIWAQSLSRFEGFKDITAPYPEYYVSHAPLYSILLSPVIALFPNDILAAKWATILAGAFLIGLFFKWVSRYTDLWIGFIATCILLTHPLLLLYGTQILSDIPFALLVLGLLLAFEKDLSEKGQNRIGRTSTKQGWRARFSVSFLLLLVGVVAATFLRELGWAIAATVVLFVLIRRRFFEAGLLAGVPLVFQAVWYYRNEILVTAFENPSLQKLQVYLGHFYSTGDSSLVSEFLARTLSNLTAYYEMISALVFFPEYSSSSLGSLSPALEPYGTVGKMLASWEWVLMALPLLLAAYGIYRGLRLPIVRLVLVFCGFYFLIILFYPFVDVRFFVVILPLILFFASCGVKSLLDLLPEQRDRRMAMALCGVVTALCMVPNLAWNYTYAGMTQKSEEAPLVREERNSVSHTSTPYDAVGEWIERHTPADAVVASRAKGIAFWIGERKLVRLQMAMVVDVFDGLLRDHEVRYLICVVNPLGLRDMEAEMAASRLRSFRTVFRAGMQEVVEVGAFGDFPDGAGEEILTERERLNRQVMRKGIRLFFEGEYAAAEEQFAALSQGSYQNAIVQFYGALAAEFSKNTGEAKHLFARLRQLSQTSFLIGLLSYHEALLRRRENVETITSTLDRASALLGLAHDYWSVGFKREALTYVRKSLDVDSLFFPALEASTFFSFATGDTSAARRSLDRLSRLRLRSIHLPMFSEMFRAFQALRTERHPRRRAGLRLSIAEGYLQYAMKHEAKTELIAALSEDPQHVKVLELLVNTYLSDRQYAPALRYLKHLVEIDPANPLAKKELDQLLARL